MCSVGLTCVPQLITRGDIRKTHGMQVGPQGLRCTPCPSVLPSGKQSVRLISSYLFLLPIFNDHYLQPGSAGDCMIAWCCPICSLCQEAREVEIRRGKTPLLLCALVNANVRPSHAYASVPAVNAAVNATCRNTILT